MSRLRQSLINVDSTSLYGVAMALDREEPGTWALQAILDVGSLSLLHDCLRIPPPPTETGKARGILKAFQDSPSTVRPWFRTNFKQQAEQSMAFPIQTGEELCKVRRWVEKLPTDREWESWIDWNTVRVWPTHIVRLRGLVDPKDLSNVAAVLDIPVTELIDLNTAAECNPEAFSEHPPELALPAYTVDVALRGRYYKKLTDLSGRQVVLHAMRNSFMENVSLSQHQPFEFELPTAVDPFLTLVMREAKKQSDLSNRVGVWVNSLVKARRVIAEGSRVLTLNADETTARNEAVRLAQTINLSARYSRAKERSGTWGEIIGFGLSWLLSPLRVPPLDDLIGEVIEQVVSRPAARLVRWGVEQEERLVYRLLSRAGPGRLQSRLKPLHE